jgi:hypothetical protein
MSQRFDVRLPLEESYRRQVLFAIELLDAVTLFRVSQGVKLVAEGLTGKPIVNASGMSVWLEEDFSKLQKISIEPGNLPYEKRELKPAEIKLRPDITTIELQPRVDYAFASGITGLRGTLIEDRTSTPVVPVSDAEVHLRWLDDNGVWQDAPTISHTDKKRGDFVSILRLNPTEVPDIDPGGNVTVRLHARRDSNERTSADFKLLQGRVMEPSTADRLTFAWDELQP